MRKNKHINQEDVILTQVVQVIDNINKVLIELDARITKLETKKKRGIFS